MPGWSSCRRCLGRRPWPLLLIAPACCGMDGADRPAAQPAGARDLQRVMAASWLTSTGRTMEAVLLVNSPTGLAFVLAGDAAGDGCRILLAQPLLHLWVRSLARRRMRAIGAFLVAYFAVWLAAGPVLLAITPSPSAWPPKAAALTGRSRWPSCSPSCGASAPSGRSASTAATSCRGSRRSAWPPTADCLLFGARTGAWCVGACWALMVVPLVVDGSASRGDARESCS
mgnify:CR=1 FL=1